MEDTPQYVKDIQLKIWLSKSPEERLTQFLKDNDDMFKAILITKKNLNISFDNNKNYPSKKND
jgi:hypothetical protein